MSYIVEQKINGGVYLYEVESYWDKGKKQSRQKRTYLGVKDPKTGLPKTPRKGLKPKLVLDFGELWLLDGLAKRIGLQKDLEKAFGDDWEKIFDLACYDLLERRGFHLFKDWAERASVKQAELRTSQDISRFFASLSDRSTRHFQNLWLRRHGKREALAFDITSISSYSDGMSDVEWGYNRDGESLPQINLGVAVNCASGLPVSFRTYPGSVPDVKVLERLVEEFASQCRLREFILDRGFFSVRNIGSLAERGIDVLASVPFNVKHAKAILKARNVEDADNVLVFNGRTLSHVKRRVEIDGRRCEIHMFHDQERKGREYGRFFQKVAGIEAQFDGAAVENVAALKKNIEDFARGMSGYFHLEVRGGKAAVARDAGKMNERTVRMGKMLLLSTRTGRTAEDVLDAYFKRDMVEKYFDALKNKMGDDRLGTHNDQTARGRMFVAMIGLFIHAALYSAWMKSGLRGKMSMTEVLWAMKSLKSVQRSDGSRRLTEITKKQRDLIKAFSMTPPVM